MRRQKANQEAESKDGLLEFKAIFPRDCETALDPDSFPGDSATVTSEGLLSHQVLEAGIEEAPYSQRLVVKAGLSTGAGSSA